MNMVLSNNIATLPRYETVGWIWMMLFYGIQASKVNTYIHLKVKGLHFKLWTYIYDDS